MITAAAIETSTGVAVAGDARAVDTGSEIDDRATNRGDVPPAPLDAPPRGRSTRGESAASGVSIEWWT